MSKRQKVSIYAGSAVTWLTLFFVLMMITPSSLGITFFWVFEAVLFIALFLGMTLGYKGKFE